jgi:hypothetical protein
VGHEVSGGDAGESVESVECAQGTDSKATMPTYSKFEKCK